jgi:hypothetical protein
VNRRRYDRLVEGELQRLVELAATRESEARIRKVAAIVNRWKKGNLPVSEALRDIGRLSGSSALAWVEGADPGVSAAHAVAGGFLSREDFSESAWTAIEILVTLAGI